MLKIGEKFGRLTVMEFSHKEHKKYENSRRNYYKYFYKCLCECGNFVVVESKSLKSGNTKSCGCINHDKIVSRNTKHNLSKTRLYKIFHGMKRRCYNEKCRSYKDYGAKGIKICDEWKNNFIAFYDWAINNGYSENLTIERKDIHQDYCPLNCCWIPKAQQQKNTSRNVLYEYKGQKKLLGELAKENNLPFTCVRKRLERGWSLERTLTTPNLSPLNA